MCVSYVRDLLLASGSPVTSCQVKDQYPIIAKCEIAWPVKSLARQYMNNHRQYQRKVKAKNGKDAEVVTPPAERDSDDEEQSDISSSDHDD